MGIVSVNPKIGEFPFGFSRKNAYSGRSFRPQASAHGAECASKLRQGFGAQAPRPIA